MGNDNNVDQAKVILREIHGNTDVSREQTKDDLEIVLEELQELIKSVTN